MALHAGGIWAVYYYLDVYGDIPLHKVSTMGSRHSSVDQSVPSTLRPSFFDFESWCEKQDNKQKESCGQSYKQFTLVIYKSRVVI